MQPFQMIGGGTYVTTGSDIAVDLQSMNPPDFIITKSITGWGEANQAQSIEWWWERSMSQYTAKGIQQSSHATDPAMTSKFLSTLGISHYDTLNPPTFAALACTAVTAANPAVVSMANTGNIAVGDIVRLYNITNMQQISGYDFQVRAVSTNVSITLMLDASGFAAPGTTGFVQKIIPSRFYPRWQFITSITQASQAVVSFSKNNNFTAGEIVSFRVPSAFGMDEINNRAVRVLSVTNSSTASSITIDLDTSGYTAFALPTSATAAAGVSPAVCVPSSSGVVPYNGSATVPQEPPGTNLQDAFDNRNRRLIVFGSGLFNVSSFTPTVGDTWMWEAYKYDKYTSGAST